MQSRESPPHPLEQQTWDVRVEQSRLLYQRTLGAWASDLLELRRRGVLDQRLPVATRQAV